MPEHDDEIRALVQRLNNDNAKATGTALATMLRDSIMTGKRLLLLGVAIGAGAVLTLGAVAVLAYVLFKCGSCMAMLF